MHNVVGLTASDCKVLMMLFVILLVTSTPFSVFPVAGATLIGSGCGSDGDCSTSAGCGSSSGGGGCGSSGGGGCGSSGGSSCGDSGSGGCGSNGPGGSSGGCSSPGGGCGTQDDCCESGADCCDLGSGSSDCCKPGSNSGCSSAATGCGPPSSKGGGCGSSPRYASSVPVSAGCGSALNSQSPSVGCGGGCGSVSSSVDRFASEGTSSNDRRDGRQGDSIPPELEGIAIPPPSPAGPEDRYVNSVIGTTGVPEADGPGEPGYLTLWGHVYKSNTCTCPTCACYRCDCRGTMRGIKVELWGEIVSTWSILQTVYTRDACSCGRAGADCECRTGVTCASNCGYYSFYVDIGSGMNVMVKIIFEGKSGATGTSEAGTVKLTVHLEDAVGAFVVSTGQWSEVPGTVNRDLIFWALGTDGVYQDEIAHIYLDDWKGFAYARNDYGFINNKVTSRFYPSDTGSPHCHWSGVDIHYTWWNGYLDCEITDSILHEYGHALMGGMYGGSWPKDDCSTACGPQPGGCNFGVDCWNHGGTSNTCSCDGVIEGWARFFPTMIHNESTYNWQQYTTGTDIDVDAIDERNEWCFGGILWDIWEDVDSKNTDNIFHSMEAHDPGTAQDFYNGYPGDKDKICPIFAKHGVSGTYWKCAGAIYCDCALTSYCDGNAGVCDALQPEQGCNLPYPAGCDCWDQGIVKVCSHLSPTDCWGGCSYWASCGYSHCGGAGCPGESCYDCTAGWCDSDQLSQGCNLVYPTQCSCYDHGILSICSNADPSTTCHSTCLYIRSCEYTPCGGAGCPGVGCVDCTKGLCDSDEPGQGCNGVYPTQCNCYDHGILSICSNADPSAVCVSGCWNNPCACGGAGCPSTGCYTCTAGWCDSDQPGQGCNGVYPTQCNCYDHGILSICSNADPSTTCVEGCWNNPCACNLADCPGTGCYTCGYEWISDPCDCGNLRCGCENEFDCAAYSVDNYMPCGGATRYDWCICGLSSCTCGYEIVCLVGAVSYKPCGGASVIDPCDCGAADCDCGYQTDCINGVDDYMPCEGVTVKDYCNCGFADCICEPQFECAYGIPGNFLGACTGNSVDDPCNCNGADCPCPPQVDCANGIPGNWQPCAGVISCECGGVGCACADYCSLASPPPGGWVLLATDPDEGIGTSLAEIYGQRYSGVIYFRVVHYRPWATIADINTAVFIDADQDPATGLPDGYYAGQMTGTGADYVVLVGWEATEMWKWDSIAGWWDVGNPISLAYLDAPNGVRVFVVGVYIADVVTAGALDCAVADTMSNWDWMPDTGHFTMPLPAWMPCGGTVPDSCDCGGLDCTCGSENDCAAFAVDDYLPCGGFTVDDWCDCGINDCACGFEVDCVNGLDDFLPCGGVLEKDVCDCGGADCACGFEVDCINGVDDFMPCGGVISCECGGVGCGCADYCSLAPPPGGWVLLATDPDEGIGTSLAEIYGQRYSGVIYFRVGHYRPWATIADIDTGILIDADQDPSTGMPDGTYPGQMTGIGADYLVIVGWEGTMMLKWDGVGWDLGNPISLAYLDAPNGVRVFTVGVYLADVATVGALDCAVLDVVSNWDWMPDTGHFTMPLPAWMPCGGTVPDSCDCGGLDCTCGSENDCAAFAVDDYLPCGGFTVDDWCDCGINDCTCGFEVDCVNGVDDFLPCGGATVEDWCGCGFLDCDCGFELDCVNGVDDYWLPGDADRDRTVNVFDILKVKYHWYPGPPLGPGGYDPDVDQDDDGAINVFDILIVKANWGKTCPSA